MKDDQDHSNHPDVQAQCLTVAPAGMSAELRQEINDSDDALSRLFMFDMISQAITAWASDLMQTIINTSGNGPVAVPAPLQATLMVRSSDGKHEPVLTITTRRKDGATACIPVARILTSQEARSLYQFKDGRSAQELQHEAEQSDRERAAIRRMSMGSEPRSLQEAIARASMSFADDAQGQVVH